MLKCISDYMNSIFVTGPPVNKARLRKLQEIRSRSTLTVSTAGHTPNVDIMNTVQNYSNPDASTA